VTPDPDFKVTTFFEVEYEKKTARLKETMPNIWNGTMFGYLE